MPAPPRSVAIILPTRNRADRLRETLKAVVGQSVPADWTLDVLVVDNGSTDHTATVVREFAAGPVPVRYVHEPRPGLSLARNRGMAETAAAVILFTDDDVIPPPDWAYRMALPLFEGEFDAVSGTVACPDELRRPWMRDTHYSFVSINDGRYTPGAGPVSLIGANMAFRRAVLEKVPGFDEQLGPGTGRGGEEELLAFQMQRAGFKVGFRPDVVVLHYFGDDRVDREGLHKTAAAQGRGAAWLQRHWYHNEPRLLPLRKAWSRFKLWRYRTGRRIKGADAPWHDEKELQLLKIAAMYDELCRVRAEPRRFR